MRGALILLSLLFAATLQAADDPDQLRLAAEYPVDGMPQGNLSGLSLCSGELLAVSDRVDNQLYRLKPIGGVLQARTEPFLAPPAPPSNLPWGVRTRAWVIGLLRGNELDFEGISCDAAGNRYLVSETHAAVLQVPLAGEPNWLLLPGSLVRQARASGMLLHFNALLEGIAIDPKGERLWLAAERERRGLTVLHKQQSIWRCSGSCVIFSEAGTERPPAPVGSEQQMPRDFSDVAFLDEKLFTLERLAHQICRRKPSNGEVERCWSFAEEALADTRRYSVPFGVAEALSIDAEGAWIGLDNGGKARGDGERRPIVWRFSAPKGGWGAK
ncbi:esterase-like activity of phytase family protein [Pseudomonas sp. GCM10022186]|uniref:esterase-like activity of phytase family protein n=1 Tax=Pseudomonas sp. GCM10022186 TaxID=3252650 RepID=UPI0036164643